MSEPVEQDERRRRVEYFGTSQAPKLGEVEGDQPGDGWVILWRPRDRNEWELWASQEGGVTQTFVPMRDGEGVAR